MDGFHKLQDDLEKAIEKDDSASSVTTDSDETKHEFLTVRDRISHIIHSNKFQIIVIALVILDCLLVISELLLDLQEAKHHIVLKVLHYSSLSILGIFLIEISVRLYAMRLEFFRHKLEMFDAVIVIVSFVLDIVYRNNEGVATGTGLIVILRLWRVTRILNGIVLSVKRSAEKKLHRERRLREAMEQELGKYREYCSVQEQEIAILSGLLKSHGIEEPVKAEKPIIISEISVVAEVNCLTSEKVEFGGAVTHSGDCGDMVTNTDSVVPSVNGGITRALVHHQEDGDTSIDLNSGHDSENDSPSNT